jgi:predicted protein tyrosine phosphatase
LKTLKKAFEKAEIQKKWAESSWAKKLAAREQKTQLNDFDRFKAMLKKKKVCVCKVGMDTHHYLQQAHAVKTELAKLKKAYNKDVFKKTPSKVIPWNISS